MEALRSYLESGWQVLILTWVTVVGVSGMVDVNSVLEILDFLRVSTKWRANPRLPDFSPQLFAPRHCQVPLLASAKLRSPEQLGILTLKSFVCKIVLMWGLTVIS